MTEQRLYWLKMLRYGCLFILVTGFLPLFAVLPTTEGPWRLFFDVLTWPVDNFPSTFTDSERQLSAVLGGVLCGWAWLLYKLADPAVFTEKIRKLMVQSGWVWFILDSGGSILAGLPLNALSNVSFAVILLGPLWKLRTN
ncbi:MAG: hypothetical protein LW875_01030 [Proteobacteria bacterium]|jgi:hypothetical protein|nr:hypothetical protein [Pseudomonadota bacterium]